MNKKIERFVLLGLLILLSEAIGLSVEEEEETQEIDNTGKSPRTKSPYEIPNQFGRAEEPTGQREEDEIDTDSELFTSYKSNKTWACFKIVKCRLTKDQDIFQGILKDKNIENDDDSRRVSGKVFLDALENCYNIISEQQVLLWSDKSVSFDNLDCLTDDVLNEILQISVDKYNKMPPEKFAAMSQTQKYLNAAIEEMSAEDKKDTKTKAATETRIFGYDIKEMNSKWQLIYVIVVILIFVIAFLVMYNKVMKKPVSFSRRAKEAKKLRKKEERKNKKHKTS